MTAYTATSLAAIVLYLVAAFLQARPMFQRDTRAPQGQVLAIGILAVALHGIALLGSSGLRSQVDLGFFHVSSLIFWFIGVIALLGSLRRPVHNLFPLLFPLAALSIVVHMLAPDAGLRMSGLQGGMLAHVLLSILAYSVLSISALQAAVLAFQEHQLRHHQVTGVLRLMPPLQTMEQVLFELLWLGVLLLTLSILTGAIYIDNLFAQHLVHKSVLSILAWLIFAGLLLGHHVLGWRSHTAIRWTLGGFFALMLAYFGTKLVLELILNRV